MSTVRLPLVTASVDAKSAVTVLVGHDGNARLRLRGLRDVPAIADARFLGEGVGIDVDIEDLVRY